MTKKVYKTGPEQRPRKRRRTLLIPQEQHHFANRLTGVKETLKETIDFTIELKAIVKIYDRNCVRLYT